MIHFQEYFLSDYTFMKRLKKLLILQKLNHGKLPLLLGSKVIKLELQFINVNAFHQLTLMVHLIQSWRYGLVKINKLELSNVTILTTQLFMKLKNLIWISIHLLMIKKKWKYNLTKLNLLYWISMIGITEWLKINMNLWGDP